ncbi:pyridoxal phosphate-dependent aminotransferase [Brucepastera parasyntrophica]|uniref:pyridoxal phosphate-dependent aminotransferase n=1 Tax=Brucepastera parasyntrophica TaxID=2880008 RepID=UPI0021089366|nr:pyridoxal phosphate-dependent aminotransferase [Brucepastera parasyntrophica]ULQ60036.1 pyridoxal phosphate-dependent aminotransferase [Brucepastera parasyntrophica]
MSVAPHIKEQMSSSSFIRKMFEEGVQMKKEFGAENVYDFSIGNPDLEPPAKVKEMLVTLGHSDIPGMHGYMPNAGYPETRAAMAEKVSKEQGVPVDFSHIVMSVGAAGAMNSVLKAVLAPGDEVLVPSPYFVEYGHYVRNHGGILKPVPTAGDFSLDLTAIESALSPKTAALIINSPNNPTGKIYTKQDIASLAEILEKHRKTSGRSVVIIADEPYRAIVYNNAAVAPVFPVWPSSVIVTSFAKDLSLPGERIGYAAVNPAAPDASELIDAVIFATRILGFVNAPAAFQRIVAACWNEPVDYSLYESRRNTLMSILRNAEIPFFEPEGAFYLFCRVPESRKTPNKNDDRAFCGHLKKYHILGVPGSGFGKEGWFRLAYCVPERTISGSAQAFKNAAGEW